MYYCYNITITKVQLYSKYLILIRERKHFKKIIDINYLRN